MVGDLYPEASMHSIATFYSGPRDLRETLRSRFGSSVKYLLTNGIILLMHARSVLQSLHTEAVVAVIAELEPRRVLGQLLSSQFRE